MKKYQVVVKLKTNVLDPEGKTVVQAAQRLKFDGIQSIRVGKYFEIEVQDGFSKDQVKELAEKILTNPVIEVFEIKE